MAAVVSCRAHVDVEVVAEEERELIRVRGAGAGACPRTVAPARPINAVSGEAFSLNALNQSVSSRRTSAASGRLAGTSTLTAAMLRHGGNDAATIESSADYIAHWLEVLRGDPKLVAVAGARAQRAADWIRDVRWEEEADAITDAHPAVADPAPPPRSPPEIRLQLAGGPGGTAGKRRRRSKAACSLFLP